MKNCSLRSCTGIAALTLAITFGISPVHAKKHDNLPARTAVTAGGWQAVANRPANRGYLRALHSAEARHGIPRNMLARVAYQESRFREDIITGKVISSAGGTGIMQIIPSYHPAVDPLDPYAAIDYAGRFLRQLYNEFGRWDLALAAYNWGPGNLHKFGLQNAPRETRLYYAAIIDDSAAGKVGGAETNVAEPNGRERRSAVHAASSQNSTSAYSQSGIAAATQVVMERARSIFQSIGAALQRAVGGREIRPVVTARR